MLWPSDEVSHVQTQFRVSKQCHPELKEKTLEQSCLHIFTTYEVYFSAMIVIEATKEKDCLEEGLVTDVAYPPQRMIMFLSEDKSF